MTGQKVVTGGKSQESALDALTDWLARSVPSIPLEDLWRVVSHDDSPFEGDAVEAWRYFVDSIDRYGFVDRIEQRVNGSWRIRSVRDLLDAAGGDPL